jgi:hypothetical protein
MKAMFLIGIIILAGTFLVRRFSWQFRDSGCTGCAGCCTNECKMHLREKK